jgi:murein DD-endopeptidase MepM/ murein hydrolase activator NlpD
MPPKRLDKYKNAILENSKVFNIDPFLVAALIYDRSKCLPKTPDNSTLYGLTRIDINMHAPHIRKGKYNFWLLENGNWKMQSLNADKYPFNKWKAAKWNSGIYWTCAILNVYKQQSASLSEAFPSTPHRHYISHWFFGDNVKNTEPEDRVLTARRRLIAYYNNKTVVPAGEFNGTAIVSPLDGVPRLVLDYFGNKRGARHGPGHQGIDIVAQTGESIRAMADGRVVFAGIDMPGAGSKRLKPDEANAFPLKKMGNGGRYVAINHGNGFRTYYMHMHTIDVSDWQEVKAGQIIGTVGRSGTVQSGPHLHLEFRIGKKRADPALYMKSILVNPYIK